MVIQFPNEGLHMPCRLATGADIATLRIMLREMRTALKASDGIGIAIASNQVFDNDLNEVLSTYLYKDTMYINPKISCIGEKMYHVERCLSHDAPFAVMRYDSVDIEYKTFNDDKTKLITIQETLIGQDAIVAQHEVDHLNGIGIWKHGMNPEKLYSKLYYGGEHDNIVVGELDKC